MRRLLSWKKLLIITGLAGTVIVLPNCRRAPEEPAAPPEEVLVVEESPLEVLELPQQNPEIGITLNTVPAGLVVIYNGERWLELTNEDNRELSYTFAVATGDQTAMTPMTVADFEAFVGRRDRGAIGEHGTINTDFGDAEWVSATYLSDGEAVENVRVFVPNPGGPGTLVVYAAGPAGAATVEQHLAVIEELLANLTY